jgi:hypothetical protein
MANKQVMVGTSGNHPVHNTWNTGDTLIDSDGNLIHLPVYDLELWIDPVDGKDLATSDGSLSKPFKTITYANSTVPICASTPAGVYQWSAQKIIFKLLPGRYLEGATNEWLPNDVIVDIRRARVTFEGDGIFIAGNVIWNFQTNVLPYGTSCFVGVNGTHHPYLAPPWNMPIQHPSPTIDFDGGGGGMEGGAASDNLMVNGTLRVIYNTWTSSNWQAQIGNTYIMINHCNFRKGMRKETSGSMSGCSALVAEINDSSFDIPNSGTITSIVGNGTTANVTQKGHNFLLGQEIVITGTVNFNGTYTITPTGYDTYTIVHSTIATEAVGTVTPTKPNMGGMTGSSGQLSIKAHNCQLKPIMGPYLQVFEIDNCRIEGGFQYNYGGATGSVTFSAVSYLGGSYVGLSDCAIPTGALMTIGTGSVAIACDGVTATQLATRTLTGAYVNRLEQTIGIDISNGITSARPTNLVAANRILWFDNTLGKPIFWKGTGWVDATGTAV